MFDEPILILVIPAITGLTQVIKLMPIFDNDKRKRWLPVISATIGILLGVTYFVFADYRYENIMDDIINGLIVGLSASGFYSFTQSVSPKKERGE